MRLLEAAYHGGVRVFSERPFGYKRYIVEWRDGTTQTYSSIWYKKEQVMELVEKEIDRRTKTV
jgi:hypothetical protein|tara:strand:+ start:1259 stop:1447 length:189 start_codon:yes stop_codon:yes gene_type:complete